MHYSSESTNKNEIHQFWGGGGKGTKITGVKESTFMFKMSKLLWYYFIELLSAL